MYKVKRVRKHRKIRRRLIGINSRLRLAVFRSNQHIFAQIIDDKAGKTLAATSDLDVNSGSKKVKAYDVGKRLAAKALKLKIKKVVFDRGGFLYHGRVAEFGRGAREGGLEF